MKFLIPLISFFLGNAKSLFGGPSEALTQQVVLRIRAITMLAVCAIGSLALSCVGLSLFIAKLAAQLDSPDGFVWSTGTYVYLGMSLFFIVALVFTMRQDTWMKAVGFATANSLPKKGSPIENAVALLVMDFLEERKSRRQKEENR